MQITVNHQAGTSECPHNKNQNQNILEGSAWQFCTNNLPNAHNALILYATYASAKAFIFHFIYTYLNQSQLGKLGGRKSD
ncbi:hypothetical protein PAHAL_4G265600 [Panicum hallii]|jgi:hypothetical protein|uniref:Uncharacterized protein n=1 Tax=Panicum hallii TaxID=206008 RepID=A0A2T8JE10_9POAL|nr:hypothetical protein PAHAL_4G265600 [Panicum hallii]